MSNSVKKIVIAVQQLALRFENVGVLILNHYLLLCIGSSIEEAVLFGFFFRMSRGFEKWGLDLSEFFDSPSSGS